MKSTRNVATSALVATALAVSMTGVGAATKKSTKKTVFRIRATTSKATVATTQPATTQPATTQPATTQPATTQPATTVAAKGPDFTGFKLGPSTIKIGLDGIFTGPFGFLGTFQKNSIQVEVDRINDGGGLGGAKLELVTRDDALSAARATDIANEFVNDKSIALVIGPAITGTYNAVRGIYEDGKKVNCQPAVGGDSGFGTTLKYAFRNQDAANDVVPLELKFLKEQGVGIVSLLYTNGATGQQLDKLIPSLADKLGIVWAGTNFTQPSDQTHAPQVKEALDVFSKRPELKPAIWIDNDQNAAKTVAAAKSAGFKGIFVGGSGLGSYLVIDSGGVGMEDATYEGPYQGALSRIPLDQQPKGYARHSAEVIKRYGYEKGTREPVQQWRGTGIAADCLVIWANAVAKARSVDPDQVVNAWETLSFGPDDLPSGVPAKFGKGDHEAFKQADLWIWKWKKDAQGWYVELARKADSAK